MRVLRPYQVSVSELQDHMNDLIQATFDDLTSQFMLLPRNSTFLEYSAFLEGYEALRKCTHGFKNVTVETCWDAARVNAVAAIVLRSIVGVTPPEWQDLAKEETGEQFATNWARGWDYRIRNNQKYFETRGGKTKLTVARTTALLTAACTALKEGAVIAPAGMIHRLDKMDTKEGPVSVQYAAENDYPYSVVLYERYLGRPFASHRDSVSELVGDVMESAIESRLADARILFRKTKKAERVPGFEQAPDFFIPNEIAPAVIIEAKITGDDGTARDKVSRIQNLGHMRDDRERDGKPSFEVVACIDGRGFGVRRDDIKKLINATRGKVFTANTLHDLIPYTRLSEYLPIPPKAADGGG